MKDCVFCGIVSGAIPSERVEYGEGNVIFLPDIHPVRPGHTLVIPKEHYRWFWEIPDELGNELFKVAREVAVQLKETHGADYVQLSIVGKDVPHVHIHLIPRMLDDAEPLL